MSLLNKSVFRFSQIMFNVNKLTNFTVTLFTWTSLSHQRCHLSESSRTRQTNSHLCICMSTPVTGFATTKNIPKNIYKNQCREDEINIIFNSPCLFTSNALIQFKKLMQEHFMQQFFITKNISMRACLFLFRI